jgi:RHS repeat-associated protein
MSRQDGASGVDLPKVTLPTAGVSSSRTTAAFDVNGFSGMAALQVPIHLSQGRGAPELSLSYASGGENSVVGLGFSLSIPSFVCQTTQRVPRYDGHDVVLSPDGTVLVPRYDEVDGRWIEAKRAETRDGVTYTVVGYRPETVETFTRIEQWTRVDDATSHWCIVDAQNGTTSYGTNDETRVCDPDDPRRIFRWLIAQRVDAHGNRTQYRYRKDDDANLPARLFESGHDNRANRYPDRILYSAYHDKDGSERFALEARFDYLEAPDGTWAVRRDPFSSYRAGFEVRSNRLCVGVACVHHLPDELGQAEMVASRTRFSYLPDEPLSLLGSVEREGYRHEGTETYSASLPRASFSYDPFRPGVGETITLRTAQGVAVPAMLGRKPYQLVDLFGDGMPGILYADGESCAYLPPLGDGTYGGPTQLPSLPVGGLESPQARLHDVSGDGRLDLLIADRQHGGWYRNDDNGAWGAFKSFSSYPPQLADAQNALVDVAGTGRADLLIETDPPIYFRSLGSDGFAAPAPIMSPQLFPVERQGDNALVTFADMFGDGLQHRVRVRDGNVTVWPNLGNGRFTDPVAIADAPPIPAEIGTSRILLADVTGTGSADLLLVHDDRVSIYANYSGDVFSAPIDVPLPFLVSDQDALTTGDVVGDGCMRLIVSKADANNAHYAVPIAGPGHPYLLVGTDNGQGGRSQISYGSSATFALRDRLDSRPWATNLPKPVLVVTRNESIDEIAQVSKIDEFSYADGYFDSAERAFRGFGFVERRSTTLLPPPDLPAEQKLVRTWNQTGAYLSEPKIAAQERAQYFHDPGALTLPSRAFDDAIARSDGSTLRYAYRAISGHTIRTEQYGATYTVPFTVAQQTPLVRLIQPSIEGHRPVFQVLTRESANAEYDPAITDVTAFDPRTSYNAIVATTPYGQPAITADVYYPRRKLPQPAPPEQGIRQVTATTQDWINHPGLDWWVMGVSYQRRSFELAGLCDPADRYYTFDECAAQVTEARAHQIDFGTPFSTGPQARPYAWTQQYFWNTDRSAALPLGETAPQQLLHHERTAVFPVAYVEVVYGKGRVTDAMLSEDGGYELDNGHWWKPGSTTTYAAGEQYYLPLAQATEFGSLTRLDYDRYALAVTLQIDPLGNRTEVVTDYQALAPCSITDINKNMAQALYDPLARIMVKTLWGVKDGLSVGNAPLAQYQPIWNAQAGEVLADPARFVQGASTFVCYDLASWRNGVAPRIISVERTQWVHAEGATHAADLGTCATTVTAYTASGTALVTKKRLEGEAAGQSTPFIWLAQERVLPGPGETPLREYLPYFCATPEFPAPEDEGRPYTRNMFDALERVVRTDTPKGFHRKNVYAPWSIARYDEDDTVLTSRYYIEHIHDPNLPPLEREALEQAAAFSDTPTTNELDVMGREFVQHRIAYDDQSPPKFEVLTSLVAYDVAGNQTVTIDPRFYAAQFTDPAENVVNLYDMANTALATKSCDIAKDAPGWTRVLVDVLGNPLNTWNNRGFCVTRRYDGSAHLLQAITIADPNGSERLSETFAYGNDPNLNTVGQLIEHRDDAGIHRFEAYSILGLVAHSTVQLVAAYRAAVNWNDSDVQLLREIWQYRTIVDALGRTTKSDEPDGSVVKSSYYLTDWPQTIQACFAGAKTFTNVASAMIYAPTGGRKSATYGNGVVSTEAFDPLTGNITAIQAGVPGRASLQDFVYYYDPVGNVTSRSNEVTGKSTHNNAVLDPIAHYTYDPIYRLMTATGTQKEGLRGETLRPQAPLGDPRALVNYMEAYRYDKSSNLLELRHSTGGLSDRWTIDFVVSKTSNHSVTAAMSGGKNPDTFFDLDGNLLEMPNVRSLAYDAQNHLASAVVIERSQGENDADYYVYASDGSRMRKVVCKQGNAGTDVSDICYVGNVTVEQRRLESSGKIVTKSRTTTLRISIGMELLLLSVLQEPKSGSADRTQRYQLADDLNSVTVEVDASAQLITRQEYFPYGGTAILAGSSEIEVERKRYRYSGQEWDATTGLYYYGARYYGPGLYRWLTPDPAGSAGGINLYLFNNANPVTHVDPDGTQAIWQRITNSALRLRRPLWQQQRRTFITDASETAKARRALREHIRSGGDARFQEPGMCFYDTRHNLLRPDVVAKLPKVPSYTFFGVPLTYKPPREVAFRPLNIDWREPGVLLATMKKYGAVQFSVDNIAEQGSIYKSGFHSVLLLRTFTAANGTLKVIMLDPDPSPIFSDLFRNHPISQALIKETGGNLSRFRTISPQRLLQLRAYDVMLRVMEFEQLLKVAQVGTVGEGTRSAHPTVQVVNREMLRPSGGSPKVFIE